MSEYKKIKLKTWKQLEKDLKPLCKIWKRNFYQKIYIIKYEDVEWHLSKDFIKRSFSKIVDVEPNYYLNNFTHKAKFINGKLFFCHELWFEQEEFIKEEEFMI